MRQFTAALKSELRFAWHSRVFAILVVALLLIGLSTMWSTSMALKSVYGEYQDTRLQATNSGQDPDAMLAEPLTVRTTGSGGIALTEVDNPVRYAYERVQGAIGNAGRSALASIGLAAMAFLIGPIAFSVWGVFMATYDFSNRTAKVKAAVGEWSVWVAAKATACTISVFAAVSLLVLLLVPGAEAMHEVAMVSAKDLGQFGSSFGAVPSTRLFLEAAVMALTGVFFSMLGFAGGMLFQKPWPPILAIGAYNLFVPNLGRFDIKNVVSSIGHSVFDFRGSYQLFQPIQMNLALAYVLLLIGTVGLASLGALAANKRSRYSV